MRTDKRACDIVHAVSSFTFDRALSSTFPPHCMSPVIIVKKVALFCIKGTCICLPSSCAVPTAAGKYLLYTVFEVNDPFGI